jgi:hypothetical protein
MGPPGSGGPPRRQKNLDRGGPTGRGQGFIYPLSGVARKKKKGRHPSPSLTPPVHKSWKIPWSGPPRSFGMGPPNVLSLNPGLPVGCCSSPVNGVPTQRLVTERCRMESGVRCIAVNVQSLSTAVRSVARDMSESTGTLYLRTQRQMPSRNILRQRNLQSGRYPLR